MSWHISFEYIYFKSRRKEWSVRVWKDVKYKRPVKRIPKRIPSRFAAETRVYVDFPDKLKLRATDEQR